MRRPLTLRLGAAAAAFVFAGTGGLEGLGLHHGPVSTEARSGAAPAAARAVEHPHVGCHHAAHTGTGAAGHAASGHGTSGHSASWPASVEGHAGDHSGHTGGGPSGQCNCLGACHGGGAPVLPNAASSEIPGGRIDHLRVVRMAHVLIGTNPTSYLFPLPNPPPSRG